MQVHLDDDTARRLRLLAIRLGMPAPEIAEFAVADFLRRHEGA